MPTREYQSVLYPKFGVRDLHKEGFYGTGISIYVIDTGLTGQQSEYKLKNVISRSVSVKPQKSFSNVKHGSFVASILAHNSPELPGIAPDATVYLADANSEDGNMYTSNLIKAIKDATDLKVDIISISLGTDVYSQDLEQAVNNAAKQGILVLAAAGNCSCRAYEFPAACDAAISVGSMDLERRPSYFNTRNDSVAVFAPGQGITVPGTSKKMSGTSFAVPFASGLLALELQRRRNPNQKFTTKRSKDYFTVLDSTNSKTDTAITMSRLEAVEYLRGALGLSCNVHSYSNDVCTGKFSGGTFVELSKRQTEDGLYWFVLLALLSGMVLGMFRSLIARGLFVGQLLNHFT